MGQKTVILLVCLLLVGMVSVVVQCGSDQSGGVGLSELNRFNSYEELNSFVKKNAESFSQQRGILSWDASMGDASSFSVSKGGVVAPESGLSGDYSTTNIQVEGVDEADIVKTDGEFIYLVSNNTVFIVKVYPLEEARILSKIALEEKPEGLFINGDKLVVIHQNWGEAVVYRGESETKAISPEQQWISQTYIKVYNVANRENPVLERDVAVDGNYLGSRMVGDYAYAVISAPAFGGDDEKVILPSIDFDGTAIEIPASQIYYSDIADYSYSFTNIVAVNVKDNGQEPTYETLLVGASSNIYVSLSNIYITSTVWGYGDGSGSHRTAIHRIHMEQDNIEYQASGEVPGSVLNQFSMDEYGDFFRIATTTTNIVAQIIQEGVVSDSLSRNTSENQIYILDKDLDIVGKVEGLAPGESIYSARFMGNRCYLVTFKKVDPLFVVALDDPYSPKVLGYLKVTGYSDYLHPYDETHVIGIGKETEAAEEGDFAWYQGVKISLFDVSDVENPVEIAKYEIGDRGTDSPVLRDHKAFLFDKSKNLLVLPILLAEVPQVPYTDLRSQAYGEYVWQGAYIFSISLDNGLHLEGRISHYDSDYPWTQKGYYFSSAYSVERSLYIDDVLYTISEQKIKMNSLDNLDYINEVVLQ
ncbi:MAG: hypothetical protein A2Y91_00230 [Chloroflexi bacterium RBG_13_54_8]|nr:MAG: hypothetical protein A2Y91_00230 [Chloroflexi bacterium RBG_13_54_8]